MSALLHFLNEKELKKITVKELCDYANMNRGTFYLHYLDIYDLMDKTEQRMVDRIFDGKIFDSNGLTENVYNAFEYIKQHKDEYKIVVVKHVSTGFIAKLSDKIMTASQPIMSQILPDISPQAVKNVASFYVGGAFALLKAWLEEDCRTPYKELLEAGGGMTEYIYSERKRIHKNMDRA